MQDVSVLSPIENAWLKAYSVLLYGVQVRENTVEHRTLLNLTPVQPCDILIIHRNAQSRWVSRLGKGLAVHPWLIPDMANSTKVQKHT